MNKKPSIFISYKHNSSSSLVNELVKRLDGIADVHWDQNVGLWESFTNFMNTIRSQDYAVLIISDDYLKSSACLYEVTQLMSVANWNNKTLFIVDDSARKIFKPEGWMPYFDYWENEVNLAKKNFEKHPDQKALELELEKKSDIKNKLGMFLRIVADTNTPDIWFAIDAVVDRLKISAKQNSASDLENTIINLIQVGQDSTNDLMVATNRSKKTIFKYTAKLKKNGTIKVRIDSNRNNRTTRFVVCKKEQPKMILPINTSDNVKRLTGK